ncbi:D-alanyl-D-alanine carboxypeptidase family protein [Candidatus Liberibacter africanus]|uniref:D-alanyl-D-alanine carboxypeptidase 1 penicillin-binding protein n=1 Tax=Candidatus Liberibacter africanus PTSAPSY TaxID=1277257 RepID=A0A0G3I2A6_LIBAF|nr:D-alanyl-D-alanine carboxypeptidase family protein [Candidatus Liberibacter africanus]AKK19996.1 D-alanyl-D-alanine carboxypeptidase 1 penicillin-binding protein [Candidatus Liberibacter africanus PTSAPSY]
MYKPYNKKTTLQQKKIEYVSSYRSIYIQKYIKILWKTLLFSTIILSGTSKIYAKSQYSSFIIDVKEKKTDGFQQDELRYPASLTKMMTLYIVFEQLKSKKIHLHTQIPVSRTAAKQNPSKLHLKENTYFTVEQGILALITRSANDVSTAFGEFISGSEQKFAMLMSKKAKKIGMNHTIYKNASGLHDKNQVTTARDQATLGIMLRKKFPEYYKYFSINNFRYKNRIILNHNKLLNKMQGIDGIKTGYTRNSGFNIVVSLQDKDHSIVAVVMGMPTYQKRDQKALQLINSFLNKKILNHKKKNINDDPIYSSHKKSMMIQKIRSSLHKSKKNPNASTPLNKNKG